MIVVLFLNYKLLTFFNLKEDNLVSYSHIFENFLPGISVPFDF